MIGELFFLALFMVLGAVAPPRWGLRFAGAVGLVLATGVYVLPAANDPDWGYDVLRFGIRWIVGAFILGVGLRWLHWLASDPRPAPSLDDTRQLSAFDGILMFGAGIFLGCIVFQGLAILPGGLPGGLALHLAVALASGLAVAIAWRTKPRALALGLGVTVAAMALDGGLRYPDLMLRAAEGRRADTPRCLMIGPDLAPPRSRSDLMALTIPKDFKGPSDVLLLRQSGTNAELFRWSFRARRFVPAPTYIYAMPLCTPTLAPLVPG